MGTITVNDGTTIYYKDWGSGQPIVFSHGWPLSADDWDMNMLFFLNHGYRVIAHESTQPVFRRQASPSNSGSELNLPSRYVGFSRAGTEPTRSSLHFPDPRLFAIVSSLHLNSFVVLRRSILQLTFHVSLVV